jgi:hypothetical protein
VLKRAETGNDKRKGIPEPWPVSGMSIWKAKILITMHGVGQGPVDTKAEKDAVQFPVQCIKARGGFTL